MLGEEAAHVIRLCISTTHPASPRTSWRPRAGSRAGLARDPESLENRLCRAAQRQGMRLIKSRRRDPRALDYGRYWLVMIETNGMVTGGQFGPAVRRWRSS
jgi:hypothetical protein